MVIVYKVLMIFLDFKLNLPMALMYINQYILHINTIIDWSLAIVS